MPHDAISPYLWMIQACVFFTAMGTMTHALKDSCPWQFIAVVRAGLVFLLVAAAARLRGKRVFVLGSRTLWIRSISGSLSMLCTFYALTHLPVADTLTLTNMFPLWVALLSWPLLGEKPDPSLWLALVSGSVGVWLIQQPHFGESDRAVVAALAASFFTAVAMLGLHRLREIDPRTIVVHFSGVATGFCIAAYFLFERTSTSQASPYIVGLLLVGIGGSATVGQLLLTRAFAAGNPARVAIVSLSQIVFGLVPDVLIFHRELNAISLVGIGFILAPTAWVLSRSPRVVELEMQEGRDPVLSCEASEISHDPDLNRRDNAPAS